MLFNSLSFLIFFPIVISLYFLLPHRYRWPMLLLASYYFYMCWKPEYVVLIFASTIVDYWAGLRMDAIKEKTRRRPYLIISLIVNLGLLFSFKYLNFFNESLRALLNTFNIFYNAPTFDVLLPVGISFYTFQTLSYTIDMYRGERQAERHFGIFALYVSYFPQLVAGPIERSTRLMPQFYEKHEFEYNRVLEGLKLMLWGFFKKVVIADRVAVYINTVYGSPTEYGGLTLIVATYFFAYQIYCDFSGYSDIARGSALIMGYRIMNNFNLPYFSRSMAEFWQRWHISMTSWFRDYLYIPLGGSRVSKLRWRFNIFVVFALAGLWHGANWTFFFWGCLLGTYVLVGVFTTKLRENVTGFIGLSKVPKFHEIVKVFIAFHLNFIALVFFRSANMSNVFYTLKKFVTDFGNFRGILAPFGMTEFIISWGVIGFLLIVQLIQTRHGTDLFLSSESKWLRRTVYVLVALGIAAFGKFQAIDFIYFQF
jgi:D-alanyl-lipoteichoic acid acyltransferase DltB (MBOAT superfamily)